MDRGLFESVALHTFRAVKKSEKQFNLDTEENITVTAVRPKFVGSGCAPTPIEVHVRRQMM
jgi:hypothetical protein